VGDQLHAPATFSLGEYPGIHHRGAGWAAGRMCKREILMYPPGFILLAVQPAASRYTDYAAPTANREVEGTGFISCAAGTGVNGMTV
jgi:hypothetical protein